MVMVQSRILPKWKIASIQYITSCSYNINTSNYFNRFYHCHRRAWSASIYYINIISYVPRTAYLYRRGTCIFLFHIFCATRPRRVQVPIQSSIILLLLYVYYIILCECVYFNILSRRNIPVVGCHEYAQGYRWPRFSAEKMFSLFKRRSVAILTFEFQMETAIFDCGL